MGKTSGETTNNRYIGLHIEEDLKEILSKKLLVSLAVALLIAVKTLEFGNDIVATYSQKINFEHRMEEMFSPGCYPDDNVLVIDSLNSTASLSPSASPSGSVSPSPSAEAVV